MANPIQNHISLDIQNIRQASEFLKKMIDESDHLSDDDKDSRTLIVDDQLDSTIIDMKAYHRDEMNQKAYRPVFPK